MLCQCVQIKHISHYTSHIVRCDEGSVQGVLSVVLQGSFLWLNVYRMTQGHNSCQFVPPLGTRRNRGNLFSLARLSSHTESMFVLFDCIAPLGSLTLLPPSILSPLLPSLFFFCSHFYLFPFSFTLISIFPYSLLASSFHSLHPSFPLSTATQG